MRQPRAYMKGSAVSLITELRFDPFRIAYSFKHLFIYVYSIPNNYSSCKTIASNQKILGWSSYGDLKIHINF